MYFIPLIQSSANAVCFYLQLFQNPASLPLLLCHFGPSRTPFSLHIFPLIASYLLPWALLFLFPPYNLVSTRQSREVFKGPVRSEESPEFLQVKSARCLRATSPTLSITLALARPAPSAPASLLCLKRITNTLPSLALCICRSLGLHFSRHLHRCPLHPIQIPG